MKTEYCKNCNTKLLGSFCHHCGQKKLDQDFLSLKNLISQAIGYLFSIDSKLWTSFKLLLFSTGKLSEQYIAGKRKNYMLPFQVFVVANLIFFFFLSEAYF
jgi:hypothetical protein